MRKKSKRKHINDVERKQRQFDRELRDCMRCKFFWGNNHRCQTEHCFREKKSKVSAEEEKVSKCEGCCYNNGTYCFPCMKDLLGKRGSNERKN